MDMDPGPQRPLVSHGLRLAPGPAASLLAASELRLRPGHFSPMLALRLQSRITRTRMTSATTEERDLVLGAGEGRRVLDHHVLVRVLLPVRVSLQLSLGQVKLPLKKLVIFIDMF